MENEDGSVGFTAFQEQGLDMAAFSPIPEVVADLEKDLASSVGDPLGLSPVSFVTRSSPRNLPPAKILPISKESCHAAYLRTKEIRMEEIRVDESHTRDEQISIEDITVVKFSFGEIRGSEDAENPPSFMNDAASVKVSGSVEETQDPGSVEEPGIAEEKEDPGLAKKMMNPGLAGKRGDPG